MSLEEGVSIRAWVLGSRKVQVPWGSSRDSVGGQEVEEGHKDWAGGAETWVRVAGSRRSCCICGCEKTRKDSRRAEGLNAGVGPE